MSDTMYKNWTITYNPKPIPTKIYDYDVVHEDFDGSSDSGDNRYFTTESASSAKLIIDNWEE